MIADKYAAYSEKVKAGEDPGKVLDSIGIKKYCCRRMLLTNVDTIDQIIPYMQALASRKAEIGQG